MTSWTRLNPQTVPNGVREFVRRLWMMMSLKAVLCAFLETVPSKGETIVAYWDWGVSLNDVFPTRGKMDALQVSKTEKCVERKA